MRPGNLPVVPARPPTKAVKDITPKPSLEDIAALEKRRPEIRTKLESFAAPWVVEFAGMPRSGKSGCINTIEHLLRRNNISVLSPSEGAGSAPEHLKDDLVAYNSWTSTYAIQQILEGSIRAKSSKYYHLILLDRGLFDATAWFHYLENTGLLDTEQRELWSKYLRSPKWSSFLKQVFFFTCTHETSLKRELSEKLSSKPGVVLRNEVLGSLREAYATAIDRYGEEFEVNKIQTDSPRQQAVAFAVAEAIFNAVDRAERNDGE
jgi:hypothetical protein